LCGAVLAEEGRGWSVVGSVRALLETE